MPRACTHLTAGTGEECKWIPNGYTYGTSTTGVTWPSGRARLKIALGDKAYVCSYRKRASDERHALRIQLYIPRKRLMAK